MRTRRGRLVDPFYLKTTEGDAPFECPSLSAAKTYWEGAPAAGHACSGDCTCGPTLDAQCGQGTFVCYDGSNCTGSVTGGAIADDCDPIEFSGVSCRVVAGAVLGGHCEGSGGVAEKPRLAGRAPSLRGPHADRVRRRLLHPEEHRAPGAVHRRPLGAGLSAGLARRARGLRGRGGHPGLLVHLLVADGELPRRELPGRLPVRLRGAVLGSVLHGLQPEHAVLRELGRQRAEHRRDELLADGCPATVGDVVRSMPTKLCCRAF